MIAFARTSFAASARTLALLGVCAAIASPAQSQRTGAAAPVRKTATTTTQPAAASKPSLGIAAWDDATRAANFRHWDILFRGTEAAPPATPRALPKGKPLAVDPGRLRAFMASQHVAGILVLKDGKIRLETYGLGMRPTDRWASFSVAKSFTSTLLGAAIRDGSIRSLDEPVTTYVPEMKGAGYDGVTIRQILTMTSGVRWNEDYNDPNSDVLRAMSLRVAPGVDPVIAYMSKLPREAEPGTRWKYNSGETNLVGLVVQRATGRLLSDYARDKIVGPAGFEGSLNWQLDASGHNFGGCCLSLRLRDYARFGQFALEGGKGVVPDGWFTQASHPTSSVGTPGYGYGFLWWTYPQGRWGAQGVFGQAIIIYPDKNAVVVVLSSWSQASDLKQRRAQQQFADELVSGL